MAKRKVEIKEYVDRGVKPHDPNKKNCIVTDLDGTLALINGRGYFDPYKFDTDILNKEVHNIIYHSLYFDHSYELIIITGRSEAGVGRNKTEKWLKENDIEYDKLFMRKPGDFRKDYITKSEIIQELQKEYNIICAFDDRDSSAKAFRDNGVLCLQVWEDDTEPKPCSFCKKIQRSHQEKIFIDSGDHNYLYLFEGFIVVKDENGSEDDVDAAMQLKHCPECGRKMI